MNITRTLIPSIRNEWHIVVEFMHGDADGSTKHTFKYKTEEEFLKDAKEIPVCPYGGGREKFDSWAEENFQDRPSDNEYNDDPAEFDGAEFFHYDESGQKWSLKIEEQL